MIGARTQCISHQCIGNTLQHCNVNVGWSDPFHSLQHALQLSNDVGGSLNDVPANDEGTDFHIAPWLTSSFGVNPVTEFEWNVG